MKVVLLVLILLLLAGCDKSVLQEHPEQIEDNVATEPAITEIGGSNVTEKGEGFYVVINGGE